MTDQLIVVCASIIIYELLKLIKIVKIINANLRLYKKIFFILKNKTISETRKEKLIFLYSKSLLIVSIKLLFTSILIIILILGPNILLETNFDISFILIKLTVLLFIYHFIRKQTIGKL